MTPPMDATMSQPMMEMSPRLRGLGEPIAAPNQVVTPEQFGATAANNMAASGGPIPGLDKLNDKNASSAANQSDISILNVALLLEYLESEFYARVVAADTARPYLTGRVKYASQILARDEAAHVQNVSDAIRKLGGTPIEKPQFQFPANVFSSSVAFLQLSIELEENGVGAYLGAAPLVKNKDVLNFAASIYGIEARHTGWVRYLIGDAIAPRELEKPRTIAEATAAAAPYIVGGIPAPAPAPVV